MYFIASSEYNLYSVFQTQLHAFSWLDLYKKYYRIMK